MRHAVTVASLLLIAFLFGLIVGAGIAARSSTPGAEAELQALLRQSGQASQALIAERDALAGQLASERDRATLEREALESLLDARPQALIALEGVDLDYLDGEIERGRFAHAYYVEHPDMQTPQTGDTEFNQRQVRKYELLAYVSEQLRALRDRGGSDDDAER